MTSASNTVAGPSGPATTPPPPQAPRSRRAQVVAVTVVLLVLLCTGAAWALSLGSIHVGLGGILHALTNDSETSDIIIRSVRLPRLVLAIIAGAALAVAGAMMQAVTANPLAAPEIMGVNAGAVLVVVLAMTAVPSLGSVSTLLLAFAGAAAAGLTVMTLAGTGRGKTSPVRLALAGVTASTLLMSLAQVLIVFHENQTENVLFWLVGGVNYGTWTNIANVAPWIGLGLAGSFVMARSLNLLALGEDMARGLGQRVERTRLLGSALVIVLCGATVSVAGPVAFIGLVVPHIIRRLVGSSYIALLPLSAIGGSVLLVYADIASRFVRPPYEQPAGVVTALIGAPIFVYLARRQKAQS